jgi:CO/xanthine dehydrogenase Mo-binding subunit
MEGNPFSLFSWAAAVVETEIDPIDYEPRVRGVWLSVDGGRILSERKARSSLEIATLHALGWATRERIAYDAGALAVEDVLSYQIPLSSDAPPITVDFTWTDSAAPKGIGELPFACVPAAFAQAVSQATGTSFDELPIRPDSVRKSLEDA